MRGKTDCRKITRRINLMQETLVSNLDPHRQPSTYGSVEARLRAIGFAQPDVIKALQQCSRLATLGESLARISHDLRNMLATGQLMAERLEGSRDPLVTQVLPKLISSLDRAIHLCESTIRGDGVAEAPPLPKRFDLADLVAEVATDLGLSPKTGVVRCHWQIPPGFAVTADPNQLYRVLSNLIRNAAEAIQATGVPGEIAVRADRVGTQDIVTIADTGPGLPDQAVARLFEPYTHSTRRGGSGLGLAIAHELVSAQNGSLTLLSTGPEGTQFQISLPAD